MPEGLVAVDVPPGEQKIVLEIPTSAAERVGRWISALCVLLFVIFWWKKKDDRVLLAPHCLTNEQMPAQA
jgi:hypothetical protein